MFSWRSHKENAELTRRTFFDIRKRTVNTGFTCYSPFGKIDGERGFSCRGPSALRDWIMLGVLVFSFLASQALGYTCSSFAVNGPWFSHFLIVFNFFLASCRRSEVSMFAYAFILSSCTSLTASVMRLLVFPLWNVLSTYVMEACFDSSDMLF